jgi:hypothetical protein
MPLKVIGKKVVYGVKVLLGYQNILDPRDTKTFKGRRSQKKQRTLRKWRK